MIIILIVAVESVVNSNFLLNFHEEFKKICFLYENLIIIHISKSITNLTSSKKLYYISILIEVGYMYEYITCTYFRKNNQKAKFSLFVT